MNKNRIIQEVKPKHNKVYKSRVNKAIKEYFDNKNANSASKGKRAKIACQKVLMHEMKQVVFEVIEPQLANGYRLDLNDTLISETLGVVKRRGAQLRALLKEAGIIFFPPWSKTWKKGQYPLWMLRKEFINYYKEKPKAKRVVKNPKYNPQYYTLFKAACKEVYRDLVEADAYITIREYMMTAYMTLNNNLARMGIPKESLLA